MADSINNLPPSSPISELPPPEPNGSGSALFKQASDFYSWHLSTATTHQPGVYRNLSQIMRIAKVSADGANFLSPADEESAQGELSDLSENLTYGTVVSGDVSKTLTDILAHIKEDNPHAKLIGTATELEYHLAFDHNDDMGEKLASDFNELFDKLEQKVISGVTNFQAEVLSRDLSTLVETHDHNDLPGTFNQLESLLKHWP